MTWQDAGVVLIVGAAVVYLVRKFVTPTRRRRTPAAFIPLAQLKTRRKD